MLLHSSSKFWHLYRSLSYFLASRRLSAGRSNLICKCRMICSSSSLIYIRLPSVAFMEPHWRHSCLVHAPTYVDAWIPIDHFSVLGFSMIAQVHLYSPRYGSPWKESEAEKNLLRTHTTAVSSRMLYKLAQEGFKPAKYFSIDRVFRNEAIDRTHLAEFHQIEGMNHCMSSCTNFNKISQLSPYG